MESLMSEALADASSARPPIVRHRRREINNFAVSNIANRHGVRQTPDDERSYGATKRRAAGAAGSAWSLPGVAPMLQFAASAPPPHLRRPAPP